MKELAETLAQDLAKPPAMVVKELLARSVLAVAITVVRIIVQVVVVPR